MLSGRAVLAVVILGLVAGVAAIYVEIDTRLQVRLLFEALIEGWLVGVAVLVLGAFGLSRGWRGSRPAMLAGIPWLSAAGGSFAFVLAVCADCMA
jgi:hypothetical protein